MKEAFLLAAIRYINKTNFEGHIKFNFDEAVYVWLYNGAGFYVHDDEDWEG